MELDEAYELISAALTYQVGAFYGAEAGMAIGAGLFVSNLKLPLFDTDRRLFRTVRADVYVLTHECDVEQENDRPYNDYVLVSPIIHFDEFVHENRQHPNLPGLLTDLATRNVPRLIYVPSLGDPLPYGGVLYLNRITSTHLSAFDEEGVARIGAVSATGLREVDSALQNLLMREKSDRLWGMASL